jgi:general secretion pathway protein A
VKTKALLLILLLGCLALPCPAKTAEPVDLAKFKEHFDRASYNYLIGNHDRALLELSAALKIQPHNAAAENLLKNLRQEKAWLARKVHENLTKGKASFMNNDLEQAAASFQEVLRLDPHNTEAAEFLRMMETKSLAKVEDRQRFYLLAFSAGGAIVLALLVVLLTRWVNRYLALQRSRRVKHCFSCGAEISTNIDQCHRCGAWIGAKMQRSIGKAQRVWYKKFGWRSNPFTLDIHPELFTGFKEEVKLILQKIASGSGHILITAPLGSGKTTLLRWLSHQLVIDSFAVYLPRPPQEFSQLIKLIVEKMGVPQKEAIDYDIYHLQELRKRIGKTLIILMDEAHEFTLEIEKPLRTLGDIDGVKLVMAGLPETVEKFKEEIRPLYERLVLNINLKPIDLATAKELIRSRIEYFGGEGTAPFADDAIQAIYELSGGVPRKVIKACDWAVTRAIETGVNTIEAKLLEGLKTAPSLTTG